MAKKKKPTKQERHDARIRKAKQWLITYQGTPKHMTKHYRERFHVDSITAVKDLQEIGVVFTQEYLDNLKRSEVQRIQAKHAREAVKKQKEKFWQYRDCDGTFAFIAGYTDGGAPYGLTWEEVGIVPELPFDEKVLRYQAGDFSEGQDTFNEYEGLFD